MMWFTVLLLFFTGCFTYMYMAAGVDTPGHDGDHGEFGNEEFPGRYVTEKFFMFSLHNTLGNLQLPGFGMWTTEKNEPNTYINGASSMVILGLLI